MLAASRAAYDARTSPSVRIREYILVPLPKDLREASRQRVLKLKYLTLEDGKLTTLSDYATANGYVTK
jgi:hypothetical protein